MAQIRLAIGQVNIVDWLVVKARKTSTPLVVEASEAYAPPQPANRNVVVPAVGNIDPTIYYIDFYESPDGVALGILLAQFVYDLKNQRIIAERRYYKVGGIHANDPPANQDTLTDTYLDGKTISGVFMEGIGRPLVPPDYDFKEYDPVVGGGIKLLNGKLFAQDEVVVVEISFAVDQITTTGGGGLYNGVVTLTANTTLNNTHRGKRLKCESNSSSRQVHTLEDVATVPDGTFYHFTQNAGNQLQTKILPFAGQSITYNKTIWTEMTIAPGEYLRIEKTGSIWEATMVHPGILQVGERIPAQWKDHPNAFPEDGTLYDGDDYPRIWDFVKNKLPATHKITDDLVIGGGYVHPVDKVGLFVIHSTLKKFRMPNTQNISERGLKSFTAYNADAERLYDYPGGVQNEMIGPHTHSLPRDAVGALNIQSLVDSANADESINSASQTGTNSGTENRVKNIGVIYLRRI